MEIRNQLFTESLHSRYRYTRFVWESLGEIVHSRLVHLISKMPLGINCHCINWYGNKSRHEMYLFIALLVFYFILSPLISIHRLSIHPPDVTIVLPSFPSSCQCKSIYYPINTQNISKSHSFLFQLFSCVKLPPNTQKQIFLHAILQVL